jgi:thioredoxin 1
MASVRTTFRRTFNTTITLCCILGFYSNVSCSSNQNDSSKASSQKAAQQKQPAAEEKSTDPIKSSSGSLKVTFIELGSVNCVPCKMMQPVMKNIEEKYGDQVKVVFHDVWTPEGKPYGAQYGIRAIPTQVFLDKDGKEYFRHEGFFAEEELVKILQMKDVN